MKSVPPLTLLLVCLLAFASTGIAATAVEYTRLEDVVYGRVFGTALTLDVFEPAKPNGAAVISIVSGGWYSSHGNISPRAYEPYLARGYTVFAVVHASRPRFTIDEIVAEIHRATRFVRHSAASYGIDPGRIGVTGTSAGGHLSLLLGLTGGLGDPAAKDPIDRESSAVQAVACFCPPTDFSNWTGDGETALVNPKLMADYGEAFGPRLGTEAGREALDRELSPIRFVRADMPPTLVLHGNVDRTVPIYQATRFAEACAAVGGVHRLVVREGKDHNWPEMNADRELLADWFDRYLPAKTP